MISRTILMAGLVAGLGLTGASVAAAETANFKPGDSVPFYGDANCMVRKGQVSGKEINGLAILSESRGCLKLAPKGDKTYYVLKSATSACKTGTQMAQGPVASVQAGSQGASGCKGN